MTGKRDTTPGDSSVTAAPSSIAMGESIPTGATMERRGAPVRVPKDRYISPEAHRREVERLWPRVWQIACRADDVPAPGNYVEYTIADQSILVLPPYGPRGLVRRPRSSCGRSR